MIFKSVGTQFYTQLQKIYVSKYFVAKLLFTVPIDKIEKRDFGQILCEYFSDQSTSELYKKNLTIPCVFFIPS